MCKVIYSPKYSLYNLGKEHPFSPLRAEMTLDLLKALGHTPTIIEPEAVSPEELLTVHNEDYVRKVEAVSKGETVEDIENYGFGTLDNPIVKGMAEGARTIAGGTLLGAKLLLSGKEKKVLQMGGGFHHAHPNLAAGFCIYNDLALAIKEMTSKGWHVAYLDLDVHHGDGVQEIFYSDGSVMTISLHESGEFLFPGTGWLYEKGQGMGRSLKLNLPLEPFTEGDSYLEVIENTVVPALRWFRPDALVVQAGADPHYSDPLADLLLTTQDFQKIYERVFQIADEFAKGNLLITLGGGYSITATSRIWALLFLLFHGLPVTNKLPETWRLKWEKILNKEMPEYLHDPPQPFDPIPRKEKIVAHNRDLVRRLLDSVSPDWL